MVGGVEGSALASGVRYYADDGAALETTDGRGVEMSAVAWPVRKAERWSRAGYYRWWAALRGAPWRGQLGRQSDGAALGTTDGGRRRGERRGMAS